MSIISGISKIREIRSGTLANRPAAGKIDSYYLVTTTKILYRDNGTDWEIVSPVGAKYDIIWGLFCRDAYYVLNPIVNTIYIVPVIIPYPMTISHLCLPILLQGGNAKAAIYDDDGTVPGKSPEGATRLAVTASELVSASYTRMDMALTTPLIFTEPGLKWLAMKGDDNNIGLTRGLPAWSEAAGPTTPAWAPNAYQVDPGGVYADDIPNPFPAAPTLERAVGLGVLVQSVP